MSEDHPNATAYRKTVEAFRAGDLATVETLIDADVVWHVPGHHSRAGDIRGRAALITWLAGLGEVGFWITEHEVFGNDRYVCALSQMGGRRSGHESESRVVSIFHYLDGRQKERWMYPDDPEAFDRIFGPTPD